MLKEILTENVQQRESKVWCLPSEQVVSLETVSMAAGTKGLRGSLKESNGIIKYCLFIGHN